MGLFTSKPKLGDVESRNYAADTSTDKVCINAIMLDDSTSMKNKVAGVLSGASIIYESFSMVKSETMFMHVAGFTQTFGEGKISTFPKTLIDPAKYRPNGNTPLKTQGREVLRRAKELCDYYASKGFETRATALFVSDGMPVDDDAVSFDQFRAELQNFGTTLMIMGMGIASNDSEAAAFRSTYAQMGITNVITPDADPRNLRHAFNLFSLSAMAA